jgi:hypothetical protein
MIRLFDKGLDSKTKEEISKIATDDIKVNKLGFGKKTSLEYVKQVIQTSHITLGRCQAK